MGILSKKNMEKVEVVRRKKTSEPIIDTVIPVPKKTEIKTTVKINPDHYDQSGKLTASGLISKLHSSNAKGIKLQVLEKVRKGISDVSLLDAVQAEVINNQVDNLFNHLANMAKGEIDQYAVLIRQEDTVSIPSMDDLLVALENGLKGIINTAISNCSVLDLSVLRF